MTYKCTGVHGLKVKTMGTSEPQPITTQANHICKLIAKLNPGSTTSIFANDAINDENELNFVLDMAFQIKDHPKDDYIRFNEALDAWILEVEEEVNKTQSGE